MLARPLMLAVLLAVAGLAAGDEPAADARRLSQPADSYLPPAETYLPPPKVADSYLPPPPPEKEYLPPPPPKKVYLPPPPPPEEYLPPVQASGAEQSSNPELEQSVVLDSKSSHAGFCPRRQLTRSCLLLKSAPTGCFADVDCAEHQKCCSINCGLQCVDAVVSPSSCDEMVCNRPEEECVDLETGPVCTAHSKPGQCPFHGQHCSNRILVCREDEQCEGAKLCCNLGCHRLCVDPATADGGRGLCPGAVSRPPTRCGQQCQQDEECSADQKCCENACGKVCQVGVVPFITCRNRNCPSGTVCEMQGLEAVCRGTQLT
ncbi:anthrax toxin receptor-like [Pollicipes pollicipes]|uniref:anthrax toxin receptor-like n=1 Tax=Pollicipes pollicipes TaxID=41117 RepID=UPI001884FEE5|nr:anthrax toxin receptor-like [Pollicipes pollicipes]